MNYSIGVLIFNSVILYFINSVVKMFANDFGEHKRVCCGLVRIIPRQEDWQPPIQAPIPLISVNVNASVVHAVAQVEVTQVYVNKEEKPIEAIYYFPVNPDGAVTHFQAELEGRIIKVSFHIALNVL